MPHREVTLFPGPVVLRPWRWAGPAVAGNTTGKNGRTEGTVIRNRGCKMPARKHPRGLVLSTTWVRPPSSVTDGRPHPLFCSCLLATIVLH